MVALRRPIGGRRPAAGGLERIEDAEFLLLGGVEDDARLEDFSAQLEAAAERRLPMVCANPNIVAVLPDGRFGIGPGAVAHHYEQFGGDVGKPHRPIYQACLDALDHPPHDEVLTVGDSVAHDVAGGAAMELDGALIMSGIHSGIFDAGRGAGANRAALEQLAREYGVLPRWVLPRFRWTAS